MNIKKNNYYNCHNLTHPVRPAMPIFSPPFMAKSISLRTKGPSLQGKEERRGKSEDRNLRNREESREKNGNSEI